MVGASLGSLAHHSSTRRSTVIRSCTPRSAWSMNRRSSFDRLLARRGGAGELVALAGDGIGRELHDHPPPLPTLLDHRVLPVLSLRGPFRVTETVGLRHCGCVGGAGFTFCLIGSFPLLTASGPDRVLLTDLLTGTLPDREKRERPRSVTWAFVVYPVRDSNPCRHLERVVSWATRRTGQDVDDCSSRARRGGLEPPITGPEPVVLPITPPPKADDHATRRPVAIAHQIAGRRG